MLKICILLNIGEERERERKEAGKKERKGGEGESEEWIVRRSQIGIQLLYQWDSSIFDE